MPAEARVVAAAPSGRGRPDPALPSTSKARPGRAGAETWSAFWREFGREGAPQERCFVPGDGRDAVDRHWARFAERLPQRARIIDLGCGAGVVGRKLLGRRGDLEVVGVDWAQVPAPGLPNLELHPRVAMEELPFADASFDGAASLFGIEYGDIVETARELARVMKPGARFSFLIHHRDSEIVREGGARRRALKALTTGTMRSAFLSGSMASLDSQQQALKAGFAGEPMVGLVADHFRRNIARARAERQAIARKLADELESEIALLGALERSAKSTEEIAAWLVPLLSAMALTSASVMRRGSGEPIAWNVGGCR